MNEERPATAHAADGAGQEMHRLIAQLYPFPRSITGEGVRATLRVLQEHIPLDIHEVKTGTPVYDWHVPPEWNITDAYVKNSRGERVIDWRQSNLHVINYSQPVQARMSLAELRPHLISDPRRPDWVPYRTTYFQDDWGFCLADNVLQTLPEDEYEVCIDATMTDGALTYGECYLPGESAHDVLFSTHVCHPSLCNDNLSGIAVAAFLAKALQRKQRRYGYRFVFVPATIGAITWLALNEPAVAAVRHGLVLAGLGDAGAFTYKRSRRGDADIDRAVAYVFSQWPGRNQVRDFEPVGYDERQYCSPGIDLPMGLLSRTPHGEYPEYHFSADNLDFVKPQALEDALAFCLHVVDMLEADGAYLNLNPKCEPQLGRRGLFERLKREPHRTKAQDLALLWVLNYSDGSHSLLDIATRSSLPFDAVRAAAAALCDCNLLKPAHHR